MRCAVTAFLLLVYAPVLAADMKVQRDIAYTVPTDDHRRLDVYSPVDGTDHPVAVWIHGGGWRRGDKLGVQHKPRAFVEKGFVFVSINYRFVPNVTVKGMTADIAKAIKWVHDHAKDHGGSPDNILVMGHSAGAHLAALVCTDDRYLKAEGLSLSNIKGCVPVDTAAYDIARQVGNIRPFRQTTYTMVFGKDEDQQKDLSPMTHVAKDKNIPPFLILHVADRPDSGRRSEAFAKALEQAGVKARVVAGAGKTHASINRELGLPDDKPTLALFEFLEQAVTK